MVLNKNGQVIFYTLMLAIVVIILAMAMTPVVKQFVDTAKSPSTNESIGLDCNNSSISDFNKAQCTLTDASIPYFFIALIGLAGVIIGAKVVFGA